MMWVCRHASGAGSSHQQVVGCSHDVDEEEHSDLWQIFHEEADKVSPPTMISCRPTYVPIVMFSSKDVFDPDSPVVFKHNASVSVVRLEIVIVAFLLVSTPIITIFQYPRC